jgi:hypothetical protein
MDYEQAEVSSTKREEREQHVPGSVEGHMYVTDRKPKRGRGSSQSYCQISVFREMGRMGTRGGGRPMGHIHCPKSRAYFREIPRSVYGSKSPGR